VLCTLEHLPTTPHAPPAAPPDSSPPPTPTPTPMQDEYDPRNMDVVSNASCTTNCLAPLAKVRR